MAVVVTSSERLAEIQARREKATAGEWRTLGERADGSHPVIVDLPTGGRRWVAGGCGTADAEFIAAAPADVDWLLAALSAAEARVETLQRPRLVDVIAAALCNQEETRGEGEAWWGFSTDDLSGFIADAILAAVPGKPQPTEERS